jgi:hypothetical protein
MDISKKYIIIDVEKLYLVDFSKVLEHGPEHLRYTKDKSKVLLKYKGEMPEFVFDISGDAIGLDEHTHEEILEILKGPEWVKKPPY